MRVTTLYASFIAVASATPPNLPTAQPLLGAAFTYLGQLKHGSVLVDDIAGFKSTMWDADALTGNLVVCLPPWTKEESINGLFTAELDIGSDPFLGNAPWLEIQKCLQARSVTHKTLKPRQAVIPPLYGPALPGLRTQQHELSADLIGGSAGNRITPKVCDTMIAGGRLRSTTPRESQHIAAGFGSLAADMRAQALHDGTSVWANLTAPRGAYLESDCWAAASIWAAKRSDLVTVTRAERLFDPGIIRSVEVRCDEGIIIPVDGSLDAGIFGPCPPAQYKTPYRLPQPSLVLELRFEWGD